MGSIPSSYYIITGLLRQYIYPHGILDYVLGPDHGITTYFQASSREAVENCVKIARSHTGRTGVIAFNGGFHGRTNLAMGLTGYLVSIPAFVARRQQFLSRGDVQW